MKDKIKKSNLPKSPKELLDEARYYLYECKTESDIQSFKKYYAPGEELCTFGGGRLDTHLVFFAVKKNVEIIKRENFKIPQRQDEYGTSLMSIQFTKGITNTLSIKNGYNHTVKKPDSTFSNNLDNIIMGLTDSFIFQYKLNFAANECWFTMPGYIMARDLKLYKCNYMINNIYYCPNNLIIDQNEIIDRYLEKEKFIVTDYFIIDLINKKVELYDKSINDSFVDNFKNIKRIEIKNVKENKTKLINFTMENDHTVVLEIDNMNRIISFKDTNAKKIGNNFLMYNNTISEIELSEAIIIGSDFLRKNEVLKKFNSPKLEYIDKRFLCSNQKLINISIPNVIYIGADFLPDNQCLIKFDAPSLKEVGTNFLGSNNSFCC